MNWLTTEPPKDAQFLADVGLPYAVVAAWNGFVKQFVYADIKIDQCRPKLIDTYFENGYTKTIKKWMPLPEIDND